MQGNRFSQQFTVGIEAERWSGKVAEAMRQPEKWRVTRILEAVQQMTDADGCKITYLVIKATLDAYSLFAFKLKLFEI